MVVHSILSPRKHYRIKRTLPIPRPRPPSPDIKSLGQEDVEPEEEEEEQQQQQHQQVEEREEAAAHSGEELPSSGPDKRQEEQEQEDEDEKEEEDYLTELAPTPLDTDNWNDLAVDVQGDVDSLLACRTSLQPFSCRFICKIFTKPVIGVCRNNKLTSYLVKRERFDLRPLSPRDQMIEPDRPWFECQFATIDGRAIYMLFQTEANNRLYDDVPLDTDHKRNERLRCTYNDFLRHVVVPAAVACRGSPTRCARDSPTCDTTLIVRTTSCITTTSSSPDTRAISCWTSTCGRSARSRSCASMRESTGCGCRPTPLEHSNPVKLDLKRAKL